MRIPVRQTLVSIALLLLVTGVILGGLWYQKCNCQPYQDAEGNYHPVTGDIICDTTASPEALFAFCLVVCTIVSFGFITTQIKQAHSAIEIANRANEISESALAISKEAHELAVQGLAETRRSVDSYVVSERGRLALDNVHRTVDGDRYHFDLRNVGKSPLYVVDIRGGSEVIPKDRPIDQFVYPSGLPESYFAMAVGDRLTTSPNPKGEGTIRKIGPEFAIQIKRPPTTDERLVFRIFGKYQSLGGHYEFMTTLIMNTNGSFVVVSDPLLTYEKVML